MNKLISRIVNASKKSKIAIAAITALVVLGGSAAVFAGFGPAQRPTFDWNKNTTNCAPLTVNQGDRCGSVTGPVFNSFVNTPSYGDERNFTRIAPVTAGQSPTQASYSETNTAQSGNEYWVRMLVHNDANQNTNCLPEHRDAATNDCTQIDPGSKGIATGTNVKVAIASGLANGVDVMGYVSATNATPATVWDSATLASSDTKFSVSYVPGSATLYNGVHKSGLALPDSIATTGTQIGYDQMNGQLPGCFDYSAYVYVKVKVEAPKLTLQKQVRLPGETSWHETVNAKPGDTVQWLVQVTNTGSAVQNDVVASDLLPPHLDYVAGSAKWYSTSENGTAYDFNQFIINKGNGGYMFGNYAANGGGFLVRFDTKVTGDFDECSILLTNVAHAKSKENPNELTDYANVRVTRDNCQPTTPTYSCDLMNISKIGERSYRFSVDYTALGGATFKSFSYDFGDGSTLMTDKASVDHTYQKDGTFASKVTVNFTVNGETKSATSENCAKPITVTPENCTVPGKENLPKDSPECVVTPTTTPPTQLPNTGAGNIVGIFVATTIVGAMMHRFVLGRRYSA